MMMVCSVRLIYAGPVSHIVTHCHTSVTRHSLPLLITLYPPDPDPGSVPGVLLEGGYHHTGGSARCHVRPEGRMRGPLQIWRLASLPHAPGEQPTAAALA